jgi:hypothetical protein
MTLTSFLHDYYRAKAMQVGTTAAAVTAFKAAAVDTPSLLDDARTEQARIAALGLDDRELRGRDYASWVSREAVNAALA